MRALRAEYSDRANFLTIYIKEAHPEDEWQMSANETEGICYAQPKNLEQRLAIAADFRQRFDYDLPLVVDTMENLANETYSAWPERLYIIDEDGEIAYKGRMGPIGFEPEEVENWLRRRFAR